MQRTLNTNFWALFGLSSGTEAKLSPFNNIVTESIGSFIFGAFHITAIVVLINMLIAMMTKSYETIRVSRSIKIVCRIIVCYENIFLGSC